MRKLKYITIILFACILLFLIPNMSSAAVNVTRNVLSSTNLKFTFSGLTLDSNHEYEFGLTATKAAEVKTWHEITESSTTTATVDIISTTKDLGEVTNTTDTGYVTIRDATSEAKTVILDDFQVDLKIPFLQVTNYTLLTNGKELGRYKEDGINVALRNAGNSQAFYQYEKITDENVLKTYKEIKAKNGNVIEMQNILKTTVPNSNWSAWQYWNGFFDAGFGYPQRIISAPDYGLYYLWVYFSGDNLKNLYGYILVDNLQPEISLENISFLSKTMKLELGKTITLTPIFTPENASNKIVTWKSSDETVATVDNAGKVTAKKIGSTNITATSQDGNKVATCTITVVNSGSTQNPSSPSSGNNNSGTDVGTNNGSTNNGSTNSGSSNNGEASKPTISTTYPKTGLEIGLFILLVAVVAIVPISYFGYKKYKNI